MRGLGAGIGLIGLLLVVAIGLYLMVGTGYTGTVVKKGKEAKTQASQFGGMDADGRPLAETIALDAWPASGELRGAVVTTLDADGAAALHFGLLTGDVITQIGPQEVGGFVITTPDDAEAFLTDAYARGQLIEITRDGTPMTLPAE